MPVVRQPDEAFLAPLDNLDIGDTEVFLGIVGSGSVCGYGRVAQGRLIVRKVIEYRSCFVAGMLCSQAERAVPART
jgi:hypothetical protein